MNRQERQQMILCRLAAEHSVQVSDLAELLGTTAATVRNDLLELEAQGRLVRCHGGAVLNAQGRGQGRESVLDAVYAPHNIPNLALKEDIAATAVGFISEDDSIFIGGGTSFYVLAKHLKGMPNLKIVTTNLSVVYALSPYNKNIYFIGGELMEMNGVYYTGGPKIQMELEKVFVNKAFIGVSGIDLNVGLTIYDLSQLNIHLCVPAMAQQVILLCDSTKFGHQSAHRIGTESIDKMVDIIVTNKDVDERFKAAFLQMGIRVVTT